MSLDHLDQALKLIANHGLSLVLLILFLVYLKPKADELWKIALQLKNKDQEKLDQFKANFIEHMQVSSKVKALILQVLSTLDADRVYVFSYHNGGQSIAGIDFQKASCVHEVVALGTRPQQQNLQSLPITMFCHFNMRIVRKEDIRCEDIRCFAETDAATYESLKAQNVKSIYACGLYDLSGFPIGFLGVEYCREARELSDRDFGFMKSTSVSVSTMMCLAEAAACDGIGL